MQIPHTDTVIVDCSNNRDQGSVQKKCRKLQHKNVRCVVRDEKDHRLKIVGDQNYLSFRSQ